MILYGARHRAAVIGDAMRAGLYKLIRFNVICEAEGAPDFVLYPYRALLADYQHQRSLQTKIATILTADCFLQAIASEKCTVTIQESRSDAQRKEALPT